ncbi:hypothetical protein RIF23_02055 [Lipingzhangella sp. LS1_29]|uniref:Uncharacterized protein n=1 Tax=Lipingzhangella rawalii TaxID=2055835 RepID=A0ABU2H367_9ACTN|nr:hypothetical protein [Lipingzhangella rawalii]MDS1269074.1 hypothetical protein [Lipingzhangella rawalii]
MPDVPTLPTPSIPEAWDKVDTSIDTEPPENLSEDQFDRHVETVTALLAAAGLQVRQRDYGDAGSLQIRTRSGDHSVELDLREDRGADWTLTADGEIPEGTPTQDIAARITRLLHAAEPAGS